MGCNFIMRPNKGVIQFSELHYSIKLILKSYKLFNYLSLIYLIFSINHYVLIWICSCIFFTPKHRHNFCNHAHICWCHLYLKLAANGWLVIILAPQTFSIRVWNHHIMSMSCWSQTCYPCHRYKPTDHTYFRKDGKSFATSFIRR
jgi:hypothetical protein